MEVAGGRETGEIVPHSHAQRACVEVRTAEVAILKQSLETFSLDSLSQGRLIDLQRQIKCSERELKHLEYQLSRVEELGEHFLLQSKLQQGAAKLALAYSRSGSSDKDTLSTLRLDLKHLRGELSSMENETDHLMGSFQIQLLGIAGYARVRAGDVFEVSLKHGGQKWKARGRTGNDKTQDWDRTSTTFKAAPNALLLIKASEVGLLGHTKTLAEQSCDPLQLLSPEPQQITMDLNLHGTLKLSLAIHWMTVEAGLPTESSLGRRSFGSPLLQRRDKSPAATKSGRRAVGSPSPRRPVSVYYGGSASPGPTRPSLNVLGPRNSLESGQSSTGSSRGGGGSLSSSASSDLRANAAQPGSASTLGRRGHQQPAASGTTIRYLPAARSLANLPLATDNVPSASPNPGLRSTGLIQALRAIKPALEQALERHPELEPLSEIILQWDAFLKKKMLSESLGIPPNGYVEKNYGRFGLTGRYESEWYDDGSSDIAKAPSDGTGDSGFDSMGRRGFGSTPYLNAVEAREVSGGQSPLSPAQRRFKAIRAARRKSLGAGLEASHILDPHAKQAPMGGSSGSSEIDSVLLHHLRHVDYHLEHVLTARAPLRSRETKSAAALAKEAPALEEVLGLAAARGAPPRLADVLRRGGGGEAAGVWEAAVMAMPTKLLAPAHILRSQLTKAFGHIIRAKYPDLVQSAFEKLMYSLREGWEEDTISVFQFLRYFYNQHLPSFIESLAHETWICASLDSELGSNVDHVMRRLRHVPVLPPLPCLTSVARLAISPSPELRRPVEMYLSSASSQLREELIGAFLGMLEERREGVRAGAARCLAVLRARRALGALAFLKAQDNSALVRDSCMQGLAAFGAEGRHAAANVSQPSLINNI